jgi:hypothetical protein
MAFVPHLRVFRNTRSTTKGDMRKLRQVFTSRVRRWARDYDKEYPAINAFKAAARITKSE